MKINRKYKGEKSMKSMEKEKLEKGCELMLQFTKAYHRDGTDAPDLIDVVLQDIDSRKVLFIASMSRESFEETWRTGKVVLYSRSQRCLCPKGKISGDELEVREIFVNCEQNCLLIMVRPKEGGTCHVRDERGRTMKSCFYRQLKNNKQLKKYKREGKEK